MYYLVLDTFLICILYSRLYSWFIVYLEMKKNVEPNMAEDLFCTVKKCLTDFYLTFSKQEEQIIKIRQINLEEKLQNGWSLWDFSPTNCSTDFSHFFHRHYSSKSCTEMYFVTVSNFGYLNRFWYGWPDQI